MIGERVQKDVHQRPSGRPRKYPEATILIIDDEPGFRRSLQRMLERSGFTVATAADGTEGLRSFHRYEPDLVITDIVMPKRHGLDVIRSIRGSAHLARIIAVSGGGRLGRAGYEPVALTTWAYLAAAEDAGADAVLAKPLDRDTLLGCLLRLLTLPAASPSG